MDRELSSVDSLLQQAGLLKDAPKAAANAEQEMPRSAELTDRTASITDLDADLLGVKLDDCSRYFKKEIMGFFLETKAKLTAEGRALADAEQLKGAAHLADSQAYLHDLQQQLQHERATSAKDQTLLLKIASSYATARHYAHQNHLVALAMFEWHNFARQQKAMRKHLRQAVQHYDGRKLQGQTFQIWKRWCNIEGRANRGQIIQRKEEAARQAVWGEAGVIIAELKLTVEALRKQLGQEQVAKAQLEEDMKQAFMRGVCALNLEAMSVMKRGMPPGGVNPLPAKLSTQAFATPLEEHGRQADVSASHPAPSAVQGGDDVSIAAPAAEPSMVGLVRPVEARTSITSSDMHHPILGILPAAEQTSTQPVSEDEQSEGSDHVATAGPPRQSSAINFNAALGKWALPARPNTAAGNLLPPAGSALSGAAPNAARQPRTGAQAQTEESSGVKVTHLLSGTMTYQQDLRPRSSDGILQRITVDRGPATGAGRLKQSSPLQQKRHPARPQRDNVVVRRL